MSTLTLILIFLLPCGFCFATQWSMISKQLYQCGNFKKLTSNPNGSNSYVKLLFDPDFNGWTEFSHPAYDNLRMYGIQRQRDKTWYFIDVQKNKVKLRRGEYPSGELPITDKRFFYKVASSLDNNFHLRHAATNFFLHFDQVRHRVVVRENEEQALCIEFHGE